MQNFTEIIGAQVLSAHNSMALGTVINMQLNDKNTKVNYLIISGNDDETTYLLPSNKIFAIKDAIIIRNQTALSVTADVGIQNIINANAYSISGKSYGKINEIELDDKFNVINIKTQNENLSPNKIIGFNNGILIFNDTDKKYTNSTFRPRIKLEQRPDTSIVNVMNAEFNSSAVATPRTVVARLPKNFKEPK